MGLFKKSTNQLHTAVDNIRRDIEKELSKDKPDHSKLERMEKRKQYLLNKIYR